MIKLERFIERKNIVIGDTIRRCRKYNKLNMKQLGLRLGFKEENAVSRIYQYEIQRRLPCPEIAERLAEVLGICKYALLITDTTNEIGVYFDIVNLVERCGFDVVKSGDSFAIKIPKDAKNLKNYLNHYYKARVARVLDSIDEEEYHWCIHNIDFLDELE